MISPGNLICTVGTSLIFPNLKKLDPEKIFQNEPRPDDFEAKANWEALKKMGLLENSGQIKSHLAKIREAYDVENYSEVAALFTQLPPDLRLMGAEINSIEAMVRKKFLTENRFRLILLISDTLDGQNIGKILSGYFLHPDCPIGFEQCLVETVTGLQDEKPLVFQTDGLPNLVRLIGSHYRKWGGSVAINATGGYKAQIALAVAFGQATGSPVYYKHERFDQIIRFPQIPFTLDLSMVKDNLKLWADLAEPGAAFEENIIQQKLLKNDHLLESILPLLEWIEEGSARFYTLSALGLVYWEAFRSINPNITLMPSKVTHRNGCNFRDDHYPEGFKSHVEKFYRSFPEFVSQCHSIPYSGQAGIRNRFYGRENRIIGEYLDKNRFGGRFEILTSAENELERNWLVALFNEWLRK